MDRATSLWLGVIAFGLLGAATLFLRVPHIEEDLHARAGELLDKQPWASVEVDGQELILIGEAPDEMAQANVLRQLSTIWGVTDVHDRTTLPVPTQAADPEPVAVAEPVAEDPVEPAVIAAPVSEPEPAPEAEPEAQVVVADEPSEEPQIVEAAEEAEVTPPEPVAVTACQDELDRLVTGERINFSFGSVELAEDSHTLLREIAGIAKGCAVGIEISGHTDTSGHPVHNRVLSEQRATSVVRFLVEQGVPEDQLEAIGYGDSQPIADNDTRSGRRANRRIEFKAIAENADDPNPASTEGADA